MSAETELSKLNLRLAEIVRELKRIADALESTTPLPMRTWDGPAVSITGSSIAEWIGETSHDQPHGGDDARP
jgi:hypothetical protein